MALNVFELLLLTLARLPGFKSDEEETSVGALNLRQERKIRDGNNTLHARSFQQGVADFLLSSIGALRRSPVGKLQREKHVALILCGDKATRKAAADEKRQYGDYRQAQHGDSGLMDEHVGGAHETLRGATEKFVEQTIAFAKQTFFLFFVPGLEQQRCESGRKRKRIEGGNQHGDRDGYGELLLQPASDTGDERSRYEHRGKNQRDGHFRSSDFSHGSYGGGLGVHPFVDVVLHSFHNDDGVVDDQANGQHQAKE